MAWDRRVNSNDKACRARENEGGQGEEKKEGTFGVACGPGAPLFCHDGGNARFTAAVKNRYHAHAVRIRKRCTPRVHR